MTNETEVEIRAKHQAWFNRAVAHLHSQGGPAILPGTGGGAYRARNGRKCAFGIFIPDALYQSSMESFSVSAVIKAWGLTDYAGHEAFFYGLQQCHDYVNFIDTNFIEVWDETGVAYQLKNLAHKYGLDASAVERAWPRDIPTA